MLGATVSATPTPTRDQAYRRAARTAIILESVPAVPVSDLHVGEHHVPGSTATMRHDSAPEPGRDKQAARSTFAGSTFQEKGTTFRCHRDEDGIEVWLTAPEDAPAGAPTGPAQVAARARRDLAS